MERLKASRKAVDVRGRNVPAVPPPTLLLFRHSGFSSFLVLVESIEIHSFWSSKPSYLRDWEVEKQMFVLLGGDLRRMRLREEIMQRVKHEPLLSEQSLISGLETD
jgi:hypothetical protein